MLDLLQTWPTPADLKAAGTKRIAARLTKRAPRLGERLAEEIIAALDEQTVIVPGTSAAGIVLPRLAASSPSCAPNATTSPAKVEELLRCPPSSPRS